MDIKNTGTNQKKWTHLLMAVCLAVVAIHFAFFYGGPFAGGASDVARFAEGLAGLFRWPIVVLSALFSLLFVLMAFADQEKS